MDDQSSNFHLRRVEKTEKMMITIASSVCATVQKYADARGLSFQDAVRDILGEWHVKMIREAKV